MRVAIIGPGAVGCLLGAYLSRGGSDVVFLARSEPRAARLRRSGVRVEGLHGAFRVPAAATSDAARAGPVDLAVVCVKAYDTAAALRQHAAVVGPGTLVVTFQNGLGNVPAIAQVAGPDRVLGGTTTLGAHLLGPGRVRHAGDGETFVGEPGGGISTRARRIVRVLTAAGIPTRAVPDIEARIWSKLAVNAGINALTALLRVRNGVLLEHPATRELLDAAVRETAAAARAGGLALDPGALVERTREVARRTAANVSSMLADVRARRGTEIAEINGAVAAAARARGVPAPVNELLAALVAAVEATAGETLSIASRRGILRPRKDGPG